MYRLACAAEKGYNRKNRYSEKKKRKRLNLTVSGCPGWNLDNSRLLDCAKYTDGVPWGYHPLDHGEGWEVGAP